MVFGVVWFQEEIIVLIFCFSVFVFRYVFYGKVVIIILVEYFVGGLMFMLILLMKISGWI